MRAKGPARRVLPQLIGLQSLDVRPSISLILGVPNPIAVKEIQYDAIDSPRWFSTISLPQMGPRRDRRGDLPGPRGAGRAGASDNPLGPRSPDYARRLHADGPAEP